MEFKIIKDIIPKVKLRSFLNSKTEFDHIANADHAKLNLASLPKTVEEDIDPSIPKFFAVSKLDFEGVEIHGGVVKDPTSKSGVRYMVIQPRLSVRDKKNFDIIRKLLMSELTVSLHEIKTKKDA